MAYFEFENSPSEETPISAENLKAMQKGLMELVFPIGSTYITQSDTNPNSILEFGTWERLKGRVCVGLDEDDTDFNTIGKTGGEKTHTLTKSEMPAHNHASDSLVSWTQSAGNGLAGSSSTNWGISIKNTSNTGGGQAHNNLQPYQVVGYMWIRTA